MKKLLKALLCCFIMLTLTACSVDNKTSSSTSPEDSSSTNVTTDIEVDPIENSSATYTKIKFGDQFSVTNYKFYEDYSQEEKELYYKLWQPTTKISIKVDIEPSELYKIQQAYEDYKSTNDKTKADTYRRCNLTITVDGVDYFYEEVGIRMRGNTSRRDFANSDGTMFNYVHFRFDLTETFDGDEYAAGSWGNDIYHEWTDQTARDLRKDRTFATMEKFFYKWNKNYDQTYIREVYANKMFQAYGLLAPHITICQMQIKQNGVFENFGVGGLYETVDKRFIKRNMEKSLQGGDLYKCSYLQSPANLSEAKDYGVETVTQDFTYSLKTNDDRTSPDYHHNAHLKALINTLNSVSVSSSTFSETLESVMDGDYFTTFEAVNYLVGNPDCIRHNSNNYYLYFTPDGVAYFIPYDYDRCFGITVDWNPDGSALSKESPFNVNNNNSNLYKKTILGSEVNIYRQKYTEKVKAVANEKWFDYATFKGFYDKYCASYQDVAQPSQNVIANVGSNIKTALFYFSEDGNVNGNSTNDNMQTKAYFTQKYNTLQNYFN